MGLDYLRFSFGYLMIALSLLFSEVLHSGEARAAAIALSWKAVARYQNGAVIPAGEILGYRIKYRLNLGTFQDVKELISTTSYSIPDVSAGQNYSFVVVAISKTGKQSLPSDETSITVPAVNNGNGGSDPDIPGNGGTQEPNPNDINANGIPDIFETRPADGGGQLYCVSLNSYIADINNSSISMRQYAKTLLKIRKEIRSSCGLSTNAKTEKSLNTAVRGFEQEVLQLTAQLPRIDNSSCMIGTCSNVNESRLKAAIAKRHSSMYRRLHSIVLPTCGKLKDPLKTKVQKNTDKLRVLFNIGTKAIKNYPQKPVICK